MTKYICKQCGAAVKVLLKGVVRPCGHDEAGIVASVEAVCTGKGGFAGGK